MTTPMTKTQLRKRKGGIAGLGGQFHPRQGFLSSGGRSAWPPVLYGNAFGGTLVYEGVTYQVIQTKAGILRVMDWVAENPADTRGDVVAQVCAKDGTDWLLVSISMRA